MSDPEAPAEAEAQWYKVAEIDGLAEGRVTTLVEVLSDPALG